MELQIKEFKTAKSIEFNYEELKKELADRLVKYQSTTYDDSSIALAKKDRAALNNLKTAIEDRRKQIKNECLAPYVEFENKIKDIVTMIDKPVLQIDSQIKNYEQKVKDDKKAEIQQFFDEYVDDLSGIVDLEKIFNPKWLNVTYSMRNIANEIDGIFKKIREDLDVINGLDSEFDVELKNIYLNTMDLSEVLRRKAELEERKKRLAELEEQKRLQEQKIINEQRADILATDKSNDSQMSKDTTDDKTFVKTEIDKPFIVIDFRVKATKEQLELLKGFLKENNIEYGRVPDSK